MTRWSAGLWLSVLLLGCSGRTEIILGAATDLKARNQLDLVKLVVSRDGVPILSPTPWMLTDVPAGEFVLPGSFGVYSPDGHEVRLEVTLQGFQGGALVIERDAVMSLVAGQTLFTRLTLVSDCSALDGPSCPAGQGCVEGVCRDQMLDARSFPAYQKGLELKLQCQSGYDYLVTSTGAPMELLDGADCPGGEICREGTCYKQPAASGADGGTVNGVWTDTHPPAGELLHAVWQTPDGKDLFAVGDAGTILHLSTGAPAADSGWVMEQSPIPANLYALWGTSADDVFAAGTWVGAGGILLHRNMGTWTQVMDLPPLGSLRAIDGLGDGNFWLAGVSAPQASPAASPAPVVLHWDGTRFTTNAGFAAANPPGLPRSLSVAPGGDVWLCGTNGLVGHFDGANWTVQQLMNGDLAPDLRRIFAVSNKDARVVGQGGFIAHLQTNQATVESAPSAVDLLGLSAHAPDEWVAVGDYGTILRYSGGAWAAEGSGTLAPLFGVFATPTSNVEFAVGSSSTVRSFTAPVVPCAADADCAAGFYCSGAATCERRKMTGSNCDVTDHPGDAGGCAQPEGCGGCVKAAFCTDGVCCDTSPTDCAGCNACNVSGQAGTCAPVTAGADPHGACTAATGECQQTTCNGAGGCGASGGTCGTPDCNAGMLTTYTCQNGSCVPVTPATTCPGVIACADAHTCASKCTADTDCDAASYCDSTGNCSPRKGANAMGTCDLTKDCQVAGCRECKAGLTCVDGYCCTSSSCSPYACTNGSCTTTCTPGGGGCASDSTCYNIADGGPPDYVCYKNNGVACTDSATCRTGICALGVCCNEQCTSYCDYTSNTYYAQTTCAGGTCAPVGGGTVCPNNLGCLGETCNPSCYTVWNGSFPMSGWPTGLFSGECGTGYTWCNCTPATPGGNCNGTKCCTTYPCN